MWMRLEKGCVDWGKEEGRFMKNRSHWNRLLRLKRMTQPKMGSSKALGAEVKIPGLFLGTDAKKKAFGSTPNAL